MVVLLATTLVALLGSVDATPASSVRDAERLLVSEAGEIAESGALPRRSLSFAHSFSQPISGALISTRLLRPLDKNPIADAYVRWQMTGFDATLPDMSNVAFGRFLDNLPPLPTNPLADQNIVRDLSNAASAERSLGPAEQGVIEEWWKNARSERRKIARLTLPGVSLRQWVIEQRADNPTQHVLARLEYLMALAVAGWPMDEAAEETEEAFRDIGGRGGIPLDAWPHVSSVAQQLAGMQRLMVANLALEEGRLTVQWADTALDDFALSRLLRRLLPRASGSGDGFLGHDLGGDNP